MVASTNTVVTVGVAGATLKDAGQHNLIILNNLGASDVYLGIETAATGTSGIRLGSPYSAASACSSRLIFDFNSKVHGDIKAVTIGGTASVGVFYR